ncbi:MAG: plasmid recombination protein [Clostridiales Family XIII bacterium]|jgi:hypothetical protein|nr:plasmid recombination protein [Clostridiales Family XIII bacterium]
MAQKDNFTVIRNDSVPSSEVSIREGHNERRSKTPLNADIVPERSEMNIKLHQNYAPNGTPESYHQTIERLLAEGKIVKHNFKPKSALVDEFVLDVNSEYFEENGGYEFAKRFYEEAYRYAIKEVGSEDYIVSAILHADERHKGLSERYGHDVYHYHLHVVYVPVVQKEIKWTKRAGPELVGKVKAVIPQINHTDKWPRKKFNGKFINEYSLLQDRYFEHMAAAGFPDIQRGERGSAAEHLSVEEYKYQQEKKRVAEVSVQVEQSEMRLGDLEKQAEKKEKRLDKLDEQISVKEKAKATIAEVEAMGHSIPLIPGVHLTDDEAKKLKTLAKKSVTIQDRNAEWKKKFAAVEQQLADTKQELNEIARDRDYWKRKFKDLEQMVKPYLTAIINFPQVLKDFIDRHWQERKQQKTHTQEVSR